MLKMYKNLIIVLLILGGIILAWFLGFKYSFFQKKSEISKEIILEQVKNVLKLGTVEGYFSEIFDYKDHYGIDIGLFSKKALIRVKAKVTAGFDLQNVKIDIDELSHSVKITNISPPQILTVEHDLDYYDITEGVFNSFTTEDYNKMNEQAKKFVTESATKSNLLKNADDQLKSHIQLLKTLMESYGWTLKVEYADSLKSIKG